MTLIFNELFGNQIPNGTLGDITRISSGKRPKTRVDEQSKNFDIPILGAASITGYTSTSLYSEKLLITGRVGTHGVIQRYRRACWPSDNTLVLQSNRHEYVYQILKQVDFQSMNRGSTQPLITQTDLSKIPIYIPTTNEMESFENIAVAFMTRVDENIIENEYLVSLRDTILPHLLSGERFSNHTAK
ncbi:restriction endonuclease subunit S [Streptococcus sp. zg-JUN1979]|uniref:restriction endonuclease subunit S n=1 Tax=Streptococcus sp. zg-JUN1979 TaxID=3391450 RepID=UPI0039B032EF